MKFILYTKWFQSFVDQNWSHIFPYNTNEPNNLMFVLYWLILIQEKVTDLLVSTMKIVVKDKPCFSHIINLLWNFVKLDILHWNWCSNLNLIVYTCSSVMPTHLTYTYRHCTFFPFSCMVWVCKSGSEWMKQKYSFFFVYYTIH